ncbi:class I SAM-dependent DNA methyltransferase [Streptomyces sp. NPDC057291]|uniref:class I SAM-dependent DNA methyltransferase n=1 Tax=Streptomyces sp. NPDC057291 TaxID=3346087 RepID=UPI003629C954
MPRAALKFSVAAKDWISTMTSSGWNGYVTRFVDEGSVNEYARLYDSGSHDDYVWSLERPVLVEKLRRERERQGRLRLLDFACGTGRILHAVEEFADELTGLDISAQMTQRAAVASQKSTIRTGDVLTDDLLSGPYEAVTIFRFFLNAPEDLRLPILRKIRQHMEPGALLVLNNHGHCPSLRSLVVRVPKPRQQRPNELRHREIVDLLHTSGFRIARRHGFSMFPSVLHRHLPETALRRADALAGSPLLQRLTRRLMIEQLYFARAEG